MNRTTFLAQAAADDFSVKIAEGNAVLVQLTGNSTPDGTVDFQSTIDGANFTNTPYRAIRSVTAAKTVAQLTSITTLTEYLIFPPLTQFRIAFLANTTGDLDVVWREIKYPFDPTLGSGGGFDLADNESIRFGDAQDATILFDGTDLLISTAGDLVLNPVASLNVTLTDDDADAFDLANSATSYYLIDTRNTVSGIVAHTFATEDVVIASGAANRYFLSTFSAFALNYTGTAQVTTLVATNRMNAVTIASDTATLIVDSAATLVMLAPTEGTDVTLTDTMALRINNAGGTPVNQHGIFVVTLTAGATAD